MNYQKVPMLRIFATVISGGVLWFACTPAPESYPPAATPVGEMIEIAPPLGLPNVPIPVDNPPTSETISLGRRLFYDPALSVDDTVSCSSCHHPDFGFSDGQATSTGVRDQVGGRNAPTVINSAYSTTQFWDGRSPNLEDQAEGPVQNPIEMAHTLEGVEKKLRVDVSYQTAFNEAYGSKDVTYERIGKAIASFERTVLSGNSPFDRYFYGKDRSALNASARRGLKIFRDPKKGNCAACHTIEAEFALFTDNKFHNLGVGAEFDGTYKDAGRFEVSKDKVDTGAFKTPTLRNIAQTAPYMHDGHLKTIKDVVDFYVGGGNSNEHLDTEIRSLDFLTGQDRADLVAFLESLTSELPSNVGPLEKN